MKIIPQSATLLSATPDSEALIERAGRTCYKSEDKITENSSGRFVRMILKRGHHSVLEHASATMLFVTDRGISHELVRHRLAAYSQESTRYCKYGEDISVIEPAVLDDDSDFLWSLACQNAEKSYHALLKDGVKPEIARSVLPTCLKTEIVMSANFQEWRHVINLRTHHTAHPQIRELIGMARDILVVEAPNVFGDLS